MKSNMSDEIFYIPLTFLQCIKYRWEKPKNILVPCSDNSFSLFFCSLLYPLSVRMCLLDVRTSLSSAAWGKSRAYTFILRIIDLINKATLVAAF